jgi:integration host factor subunit alpha
MALTKDKIINEVYTKLDFRKNDARHVVEQLLEIMKRTLQNGEDLLISGFGKFVVKEKKARRGNSWLRKRRPDGVATPRHAATYSYAPEGLLSLRPLAY